MEALPRGQKSKPSVIKYQTTIVEKNCVQCGITFNAIRRLRPYCSDACKKITHRKNRPKSIKVCEFCSKEFFMQHLKRKFCSYNCKVEAQTTGRKKVTKSTKEAKNAQRSLAYYISTGKIIRPKKCEKCDKSGKIEGAHFNYKEPLRVRWLCRSCHVRWDKEDPKGGTVSLPVRKDIKA